MTADVKPIQGKASAAIRRVPMGLRLTQIVMVLAGSVACFGVVYFTAIEPDKETMDGLGWGVGALLGIASLAYVASGLRLASREQGVWRLAAAAATLRVVLSLVKVFYYGETEAASFLVIDALLTLVLLAPQTRSWFVRE